MYLTAKEIKRRYKITNQTLYNWRRKSKIKFIKTPSGSFLYLPFEMVIESVERHHVIYARVSNTKQHTDLEHQISILEEYIISNGNKVNKIYKDIASGINENRKDFAKLLSDVAAGNVDTIYITYKDRLTRFGFGYIEKFCKFFDTKIEVVNTIKTEDFQVELAQDLTAIIHHFSMKLYSNRRKQLKEIKKILKDPQ